jgi:hypothetical protein
MFAIPSVSVVEHEMDLPLASGRSLGRACIAAWRPFLDAEERDDGRPAAADLYRIQLANHERRDEYIGEPSLGRFFRR